MLTKVVTESAVTDGRNPRVDLTVTTRTSCTKKRIARYIEILEHLTPVKPYFRIILEIDLNNFCLNRNLAVQPLF